MTHIARTLSPTVGLLVGVLPLANMCSWHLLVMLLYIFLMQASIVTGTADRPRWPRWLRNTLERRRCSIENAPIG